MFLVFLIDTQFPLKSNTSKFKCDQTTYLGSHSYSINELQS